MCKHLGFCETISTQQAPFTGSAAWFLLTTLAVILSSEFESVAKLALSPSTIKAQLRSLTMVFKPQPSFEALWQISLKNSAILIPNLNEIIGFIKYQPLQRLVLSFNYGKENAYRINQSKYSDRI